MKSGEVFSYTGTDNLEAMAEAVNYNAFLNRLVERHMLGVERIVDFGAGIGTFARPLHAAGRNVVAVEPDGAQRSRMSEQGIPCLPGIEHVSDGWADAIYTVNVLEHIEDDRAVLRELHAKLRLGGRLFIYVPAFQMLYSAMDRKVNHYRRYGRAELVGKVAEAGFSVIDARYADSLGFLATLLYKWRGDGSGDINRAALRVFDRYVFPLSTLLDKVVFPFFGKNLLLVAKK